MTLASTSGNSSATRTATTPLESTPDGTCLELGSGTGLFTPLLDSAFEWVISVDLAEQMLRQAAGRSPLRVRADASALPAADAQVAVIAANDMLLFPAGIARVLAPDGVLLWINRLGEDGPLYLPADDVAAALPGQWHAVEAQAGWGSWAVLPGCDGADGVRRRGNARRCVVHSARRGRSPWRSVLLRILSHCPMRSGLVPAATAVEGLPVSRSPR
ncbi:MULTISPECIES: class I SAM-dependent methyltransferase [unclassified Streptomyces]|uniref:class I SAM-dependent DNA methyltransferase n=1 Tax=unclassified Streptomyces TaxID=2593676 RepID=UPI0022514773|nr:MULTISPECIES: class I SAM-dependent methyltransferase [unclassified Streptomyces]MCX4407048.1 class I SAM-dependent methyltransferase [Streptomyces sp. NBC_01764]MCX5188264.1 class I SAM-dependent methyltransferase [Streptomyces sp. NBC_00268]